MVSNVVLIALLVCLLVMSLQLRALLSNNHQDPELIQRQIHRHYLLDRCRRKLIRNRHQNLHY